MKLYIPYPKNGLIGGPYSFMRNLKESFKHVAPHIKFTQNHIEAEAILFPVTYSKAWLRFYKRMGKPIIQRLDGLHYPQKHGKTYAWKNRELASVYKKFASHIIYQSEHSKQQVETILGQTKATNLGVIANGALEHMFTPQEKTFNPNHIQFITTGNFRGEDMLQPLLKALDILAEKNTVKFTLTIIGKLNFSQKTINDILAKPYVQLKGSMPAKDIAKNLQQSDVYLFSHLNPPCPNAVIEALSCGLPVASFDSGAMRELCPHQQDLLAPTKTQSTFHNLDDLDPRQLIKTIERCLQNYTHYKQQAIKQAPHYGMNICAAKYRDALELSKTSHPKKSTNLKPVLVKFYLMLAYAELAFEFSLKAVQKVLRLR